MRPLPPLALLALWPCLALPDDASDASSCMAKAAPSFTPQRKLDPYILRGDFDGDGKPDRAVVVIRNGKQGIAVCLGRGNSPVALGAGTAFHHMTDLDFTAWRVHPRKQPIARGVNAGRPPALSGDALLVEWEAGSGLIYWDGKRFAWYQQGD